MSIWIQTVRSTTLAVSIPLAAIISMPTAAVVAQTTSPLSDRELVSGASPKLAQFPTTETLPKLEHSPGEFIPVNVPLTSEQPATTDASSTGIPPVIPKQEGLTLAQAKSYSTSAQLLSPDGREIVAQETLPATETPEASTPPRPATTDLGNAQRWTLNAELVFLNRDIKGVTTTIDVDSNRSFGTQNLGFGLAPGARLTAGYHFDPSSSVEASFLGFTSLSSSSSITASFVPPVPGGESLLPSFDPTGLSAVEDYTAAYQNRIRYNSDLTNVELSYRQTVTPNTDPLQISFLAGFRYLKVGEGFELLSTDEDPARVGGNGPHTGRYAINANNDLFGLQIGGDLNAQVSPAFNVGLRLRAGVFLNSSGQNSSLQNNNGDSTSGQLPISQSIFTGSNSGTVVSPLVELGLTAAVDLSPSVTLTGGLNLLYVDNLALAPQQFARDANFASSLSRLERTSAFYFGPTIGIQVRL